MPYTKGDVRLYDEVAGHGRPVVLVHGWRERTLIEFVGR
jgi:hypothetical protein